MLALLIAGGLAFTACGSSENKEAAGTEMEQASVINTTNAYVCPMNCENSGSDAPGTCKMCGMELVKNPNFAGAAAAADSGAVAESGAVAADTTQMKAEEAHEDHTGHNH